MKLQLDALSDQMPAWVWNLLVFGAAIVIGLVIKFIITILLRHYKNVSSYSVLKSILTHLGKPLDYFVPLFVLNLMLPMMRMEQLYLAPLNRIIGILLIVSFASLLINAIRVLEDFVYFNYDLSKEDNLKERKIRTQLQFIRKILIVLIVLISLAIILLVTYRHMGLKVIIANKTLQYNIDKKIG